MSDWKYDVDEVGEEADSEPDGPAFEPIEPGSPTAENAFFVALGVATTLFVLARVVLVAGG